MGAAWVITTTLVAVLELGPISHGSFVLLGLCVGALFEFKQRLSESRPTFAMDLWVAR